MFHFRRRLLLQTPSDAIATLAACKHAYQLLNALEMHTKKQANELRTGNILEVDGRLMQILKQVHAQGTGRQIGNVQLEVRDVLNRSKHPLRLRPSDMVDVVRLDERRFQFLYQEDDTLHCMDPDTFEQLAVARDILGPAVDFLAESGDVLLSFHEGNAVSGALPPTVTLTIAEAAPHFKGEAQAPQYKAAVLETGAKIAVPSFVVAGDAVIVDTVDRKFVKRA